LKREGGKRKEGERRREEERGRREEGGERREAYRVPLLVEADERVKIRFRPPCICSVQSRSVLHNTIVPRNTVDLRVTPIRLEKPTKAEEM